MADIRELVRETLDACIGIKKMALVFKAGPVLGSGYFLKV